MASGLQLLGWIGYQWTIAVLVCLFVGSMPGVTHSCGRVVLQVDRHIGGMSWVVRKHELGPVAPFCMCTCNCCQELCIGCIAVCTSCRIVNQVFVLSALAV